MLKVLNGKCRALSLTKKSGHMLTGYLGYLSLTLRSHSREYSSEKKKRRKKRQNHEPIESTEKDYPITNDVEGDRQYRRNKGSKRSESAVGYR